MSMSSGGGGGGDFNPTCTTTTSNNNNSVDDDEDDDNNHPVLPAVPPAPRTPKNLLLRNAISTPTASLTSFSFDIIGGNDDIADTTTSSTFPEHLLGDDDEVVLRRSAPPPSNLLPPLPPSSRNFPLLLDLSATSALTAADIGTSIDDDSVNRQCQQPLLVVQSPKTPTLSRKFKAVSLDSDPQPKLAQSTAAELAPRDVYSMPNTPKKQLRRNLVEFDDDEMTGAGCTGGSTGVATTVDKLGIITGAIGSGCTPLTSGGTGSSLSGSVGHLKHYASNSSISGSQILKTLPEIMTLQDFDCNTTRSSFSGGSTGSMMMLDHGTPVGVSSSQQHLQLLHSSGSVRGMKARGLLERRGSNASLTIDLSTAGGGYGDSSSSGGGGGAKQFGSTGGISRLNAAKSVSNLCLSYEGVGIGVGSAGSAAGSRSASPQQYLHHLSGQQPLTRPVSSLSLTADKRRSQTHLETCGNCTIYESVASKISICQSQQQQPTASAATGAASTLAQSHRVVCAQNATPTSVPAAFSSSAAPPCTCICNYKCRRKSLSNENLYVPPCAAAGMGAGRRGTALGQCRGHHRRAACYPRQPDLEANAILPSEDFRLHMQSLQYLQTAGSVLSVEDLQSFSKIQLHQEFWEVPLNMQEKCLVSGSQIRNRYKGVIPNEHSRVHLPAQQSYIHANYIKGPDYTETTYVATQGPMQHTCEDFWEMVWTNKTNCIVMLTHLVEKGLNKCELYFPLGRPAGAEGSTFFTVRTTNHIPDKFTFDNSVEEKLVHFEELDCVTFGRYSIRHLSTEHLHLNLPASTSNASASNCRTNSTSSSNAADDDQSPYCMLRHLELTRRSSSAAAATTSTGGADVVESSRSGGKSASRRVRHFWYTNWQDHRMANADQVLQLAMDVLKFVDRSAASKQARHKHKQAQQSSSDSKPNTTVAAATTAATPGKVARTRHRFEGRSASQHHHHRHHHHNNHHQHPTTTNTPGQSRLAAASATSASVSPPAQLSLSTTTPSPAPPPVPKPLPRPLVVHCSAGIGRTGCFLAVLNGIRQLRGGAAAGIGATVDVLAILCSLRLHRGGMVQTAEQYELVHHVLALYADKWLPAETAAEERGKDSGVVAAGKSSSAAVVTSSA